MSRNFWLFALLFFIIIFVAYLVYSYKMGL